MDNNPERLLPESPDRWPLRLLIPALIWGQVILVYSSMLLPPAWVLAQIPPPAVPRKPWRDALLPLTWAVPYAIYLFVTLLVLSLLSKG